MLAALRVCASLFFPLALLKAPLAQAAPTLERRSGAAFRSN